MKICLNCEGVSASGGERCGHCGRPLLPVAAVHYPLRRGDDDGGNPLLGTLLDGKFRIQGVLGRGGMGTVYRAAHEVSLVPLAVKLLHPRFLLRPEFRRALLAEARRAGRVVHEHCARVLDVGETEDGTVYLAMELAEGETLDAWIRHGQGLPPATVAQILLQISSALQAIHQAELVHRDLSARNVMVCVRDGMPSVKVLDFGIAKGAVLAQQREQAQAQEPAGFANAVFGAPEHLTGAEVDARADLYSLGVLGYLLLTGHLPVAGHDARDAARRTIAGELQPWPDVPGAPPALVRLLQRCMQLQPERRPASAAEVSAALARIAAARNPVLARLSVLVAVAAAAAVLAAWRGAGDPFLRAAPGNRLELSEGALRRDAEVQHLRSAELATLRFHAGNFAPDRLQLEASRAGEVLNRYPLQPLVDADTGAITLSTAQPGWAAVTAGLAAASRDGPIDLQFMVPAVAPFGAARVRVDDQPPGATLRLQPDGVLRADSRLDCRYREDGELATVELVVELPGRPALRAPLPLGDGVVSPGVLLRGRAAGLQELGPGTLAVAVVDRAGNRGVADPLSFTSCDLGVPGLIEVTGGSGTGTVDVLGNAAALRLRLDAEEPGLRLWLHAPSGTVHELELQRTTATEPWFTCTLQVGDPGELRDGVWTFELGDAAGNRGSRNISLTFRSLDLQVELSPLPGAPITWHAGALVAATGGGALAATCNPDHRFAQARVRDAAGALLANCELAVAEGTTRVVFGSLPPGRHQLELVLEDQNRVPQIERHDLVVLPDELTLRLPEGGGRFLPELVAIGLLAHQDRFVGPGTNWQAGGHEAWMAGDLHAGDRTLQAFPWRPAEPARAVVPLLSGRNVLALRATDVLGRPVRVWRGEAAAPALDGPVPGLVAIAEFHHSDEPPRLIGSELLVEWGQAVEVRFHSPLPFQAEDRARLRLAIGTQEVAPASCISVPGGCEILFRVSFAAVANGAELQDALPSGGRSLADLPREQFQGNVPASLRVRLDTPAGPSEALLPLRTARTTLAPFRLGDASAVTLPPELAGIRMLPVLAPPDAVLREPVPANAPGRALFRAQPATDVRNFGDFLLQDRELTCGQYAALLAALPTLPGGGEAWRTFVHADDPLQAARLSAAALQPRCDLGADPERPVTGVDYFQAWTACRVLGQIAGGDPDWFRLPLGCELELCAFGARNPGAARNAATAAGRSMQVELLRAAGPPTAAEAERLGDVIDTPWQVPVHALDFGVREWVADLPRSERDDDDLLREWSSDHSLLLLRTDELARGTAQAGGTRARLRTFGVVRGQARGEPAGWIDPGEPQRPLASGRLPAAVPGVTRCEFVPRDGRGLLRDQDDPRLQSIGFRLAAGARLIQDLRTR